jgi:predicted dinucleotide-binding enzyme
MKVGILGSGSVGQTLAQALQAAGHEVRIGSRDGRKLAAFSKEHGIAEGTFVEVAAFGEAVVLAVKGDAAEAVAREIAAAVAGKPLLDTTNPISGAPVDGYLPYFTAADESLLERIEKAAPAAQVVKWFDSAGAPVMAKPKLAGSPTMFICGEDAGAKRIATALAGDLGWGVEDVGGHKMGHPLEALCQIWCAPGFLKNDWTHAFSVIRP